MRVRRKIHGLVNCISGGIVVLALCLAAVLAGARLLGLSVFTVLSGSMEPSYKTGSVIYVRPVDVERLESGDVITFALGGDSVATHRIVEVLREDGQLAFRTKGDANASPDRAPVAAEDVIGTPVFTIPRLGFFIQWVQHPPGIFAAIAAGAALLFLTILPELTGDGGGRRKGGTRRKAARRGGQGRGANAHDR